MSSLMARLQPFFPKSHGKPRVDDRPVPSGMIFVNRNGLRWRDAPREHDPPKTLHNRWKRWSDKGVFARMMVGLAAEAAVPKTVTIDATYRKAHRTATSLRSKKGGAGDQRGRLIGRTKGGMNTRPHAVADADGRPIRFFMTAGQVSDDTGAAALLGSLPKAEWLLADRGHDADWFRGALKDKGIKPCIPGRKSRGKPIKHDKRRYERRSRIENHVRQAQGLAPARNTLRQMPEGLPLRRRLRSYRHVLAMTPERVLTLSRQPRLTYTPMAHLTT